MSIKTIYTCDKCGNEQTGNNQFWVVGVVANTVAYGINSREFVNDKSMQVCRPCLESFGIHVQKKPEEKQPELPTLEELIREIINRCSP